VVAAAVVVDTKAVIMVMIMAEVAAIGIAETTAGTVRGMATVTIGIVDGVATETIIGTAIDTTYAVTEATAVVVGETRTIGGGVSDMTVTTEEAVDMSAAARVVVIDMEAAKSAALQGRVVLLRGSQAHPAHQGIRLLRVSMNHRPSRKNRAEKKLPMNWQPYRKRRRS